MERVIQGLPVVTGPQWAGVEYFCTTRAGGVGVAPHDTFNLGRRAEDNPDTVTENRRRLRAALPPSRCGCGRFTAPMSSTPTIPPRRRSRPPTPASRRGRAGCWP